MDKIRIAAGIASAALLGASAWMFFAPVPASAATEITVIYALGKERTADEVADINALARMLYGEARGVKSTTEQAACAWVVLNRVDDERWPDSVIEVLSQPYQFGGYKTSFPVEDWARELAADVYDRWTDERETGQDAGRVIPEDYYFWRGSRDGHNYFRKEFKDYATETYSFGLESPYED